MVRSVVMAASISIQIMAAASAAAQPVAERPVWVIDRVTVASGHEIDALAYYRSAWLPARVEAKKRGLIDDYRFLEKTDESGARKLVLMTRYPSDKVRLNAEPTWQIILNSVAPAGPTLPPGLKPADIRTTTETDIAVERDLAG